LVGDGKKVLQASKASVKMIAATVVRLGVLTAELLATAWDDAVDK
jgi:hypothetical protein